MKWGSRKFFDIALKQSVGREDEIGVRDRAKIFPAFGAAEDQDAEIWRELQRLRAPVRDDRGRGDDQGWQTARPAGLLSVRM